MFITPTKCYTCYYTTTTTLSHTYETLLMVINTLLHHNTTIIVNDYPGLAIYHIMEDNRTGSCLHCKQLHLSNTNLVTTDT